MDHLDMLENKSIYIIREAYYRFKNIAMLWSVGKDSTTLLWLIRKAFFGKIPFPIIHIDTSYKFPDMYEFGIDSPESGIFLSSSEETRRSLRQVWALLQA